MNTSLILKSEQELKKDRIKVKNFLSHASKLSFWSSHFDKNNYKFDYKNFRWENFNQIPLSSKKDFISIGLAQRLSDTKNIVRSNTYRFMLKPTAGTSRETGPVLFLKNADVLVNKSYNQIYKTLILFQPRAISLRYVLSDVARSINSKNHIQSLVLNPFRFKSEGVEAVKEFNGDSIITFPACIGYMTSNFRRANELFHSVKRVWLSGDFLSVKELDLTKSKFKNVNVDIDYITTEVDTIGVYCKFLRSQFGPNTYHPNKDKVIELIDIDENGQGEIVVTKMEPIQMSFIRYRTGDVGRWQELKCKCGESGVIFLEGRKNMDIIKGLGVLITRAEIERVILMVEKEIDEWRGEVREVERNGTLLGELTLLIKPNQSLNPRKIENLKKTFGENLLLTPKKTLSQLSAEKKFMPLKIKIVKQFEEASKKVLLRKILD